MKPHQQTKRMWYNEEAVLAFTRNRRIYIDFRSW
jgi:hypothetical protein